VLDQAFGLRVGQVLTRDEDMLVERHVTQNIRGELQDPHFDTEWFDYVAVLPPSME
jgi:hypothetical protein